MGDDKEVSPSVTSVFLVQPRPPPLLGVFYVFVVKVVDNYVVRGVLAASVVWQVPR